MRRHLADKGVEMHEARKVVDHLAAGDDRVRDPVSAGPALGEKIVQGPAYGAEAAPAANPTAPGTLQTGLKLRLHPPVQTVKHLAIDRKQHGLQRGGTDVYPKKQRPIHADTRLLQENWAANFRSGTLPNRTSAVKCVGQAPLGAGRLYP